MSAKMCYGWRFAPGNGRVMRLSCVIGVACPQLAGCQCDDAGIPLYLQGCYTSGRRVLKASTDASVWWVAADGPWFRIFLDSGVLAGYGRLPWGLRSRGGFWLAV